MGERGFKLVYAAQLKQHLAAIPRKHHSLIRTTIVAQLQFRPDEMTRNRKPLKRPVELAATWELRFGPQNRFRVFYDVDRDLNEVHVLAIGVKRGNRLWIANEEIEL